jgi:hypothetical protein
MCDPDQGEFAFQKRQVPRTLACGEVHFVMGAFLITDRH